MPVFVKICKKVAETGIFVPFSQMMSKFVPDWILETVPNVDFALHGPQ